MPRAIKSAKNCTVTKTSVDSNVKVDNEARAKRAVRIQNTVDNKVETGSKPKGHQKRGRPRKLATPEANENSDERNSCKRIKKCTGGVDEQIHVPKMTPVEVRLEKIEISSEQDTAIKENEHEKQAKPKCTAIQKKGEPKTKGRKPGKAPAVKEKEEEDEGPCDYELLRAQHIKNRYEMLEKCGLVNSKEVEFLNSLKPTQVNRKKINRALTKRAREFTEPTRKSTRISLGPPKKYTDLDMMMDSKDASYSDDDDDDEGRRGGKTWTSHRIDTSKFKFRSLRMDVPKDGRIHDHIPGIPVGQQFHGRYETHYARIHSGLVRGIWADSKGYEDDFDLGEVFTFTGAGGRNLKGTKNKPKNLRTAPQSCDQTLTGPNLGLAMACENKNPVRVLRGYKLDSEFAPEWGYRYDGLYDVVSYCQEVGKAGFAVLRYAFKRRSDQDPPPWGVQDQQNDGDKGTDGDGPEDKKAEEDDD